MQKGPNAKDHIEHKDLHQFFYKKIVVRSEYPWDRYHGMDITIAKLEKNFWAL
jgi:hypothetical protein